MRREQYERCAWNSALALRRNYWLRFRASEPLTALAMSIALGAALAECRRLGHRYSVWHILNAGGAW